MLDYLPLIIILAALGVMAYYMTRGKKKGHEDRESFAAGKGWEYKKADAFNAGMNSDDRQNLLYTVEGRTAESQGWEMNTYMHLSSQKTGLMKKELLPSSEWKTAIPLKNNLVIIPLEKEVPEMVLKYALRSLKLPEDIPRIREGLPEGFSESFAVFSDDVDEAKVQIARIAPEMLSWRQNHPGAERGITVAGGPDGIRLNVTWTVEKPEDMESMINIGLGFIDLYDGVQK